VKYRHACHAGNFADVLKHVALVAALTRLAEKPRPLFVLDTHAGRGRYDVTGAAEAAQGIGQLMAAGEPPRAAPIVRYLDLVGALNPGERHVPRAYPGSPLIVAALLRDSDRAAFCELVPGEVEALRREFHGDARIGVHCRDGFEALGALLPSPGTRGLVLVDPPYEEQEKDLDRVADALASAAARWPQGVLLGWYPIKQGAVAARLHRRLLEAGVRRLLVAELCIHPDDSRAGLNGSGVVAINPPYRFDEDLRDALPELHRALAEDGAGRTRVEMLAGE
jgi:23S rRNA (adenine2030-N6)-methyltransferase